MAERVMPMGRVAHENVGRGIPSLSISWRQGTEGADGRVLPTRKGLPDRRLYGGFVGTHGNAGQANYATAKAGVLGLTKTVAKGEGERGGLAA